MCIVSLKSWDAHTGLSSGVVSETVPLGTIQDAPPSAVQVAMYLDELLQIMAGAFKVCAWACAAKDRAAASRPITSNACMGSVISNTLAARMPVAGGRGRHVPLGAA